MGVKLPTVGRLKKTWERFSNDYGSLLAASVAYFAALSLFPLLLVVTAGLGYFFQFTQLGQDSQEQMLEAVSVYVSSAAETQIEQALGQVQQNAAVGGPLGLLGLLVVAIGIFVNFDIAFDRIWNIPQPETQGLWGTIKNLVLYRLRAFLMLLGVGAAVLAVFIAGVAMSTARAVTEGWLPLDPWAWSILQFIVSLSMNVALFTVIYKVLPKAKVRWSEALSGALLTALTWELGRYLLSMWLTGGTYNAYGVIGAFLAIMLWIYYACILLFLGAEYIQVICAECDDPSGSDAQIG